MSAVAVRNLLDVVVIRVRHENVAVAVGRDPVSVVEVSEDSLTGRGDAGTQLTVTVVTLPLTVPEAALYAQD